MASTINLQNYYEYTTSTKILQLYYGQTTGLRNTCHYAYLQNYYEYAMKILRANYRSTEYVSLWSL
jgi:hypothetical protein